MNAIDFIIGLTLMNAMPHFVIGVWKGRILSAFAFRPREPGVLGGHLHEGWKMGHTW